MADGTIITDVELDGDFSGAVEEATRANQQQQQQLGCPMLRAERDKQQQLQQQQM